MSRTVFSALVLVSLVASAVAQPIKSRGFIPPFFTLPKAQDEVRFTGSSQPRFQLPEYPVTQLNAGKEGSVEATLFVTSEGQVVYTEISVTSGIPEFDTAVLESCLQSSFPAGFATVKGVPHDFKISIPFYFLLAADPEQYWHSRLELARIQIEYEAVMKKFEDIVMSRTTASSARKHEVQRQMEGAVAAAKRIHRILAEKKEKAIIRLRGLIDASRGASDPIAENEESSWRWAVAEPAQATVQSGATGVGVISIHELSGSETERLAQELELKKAYL